MANEISAALIGGLSGAIVAQLTSSFEKSKILFEKRLEALSALHTIRANLLKESPEQMGEDWFDCQRYLVYDFSLTQKELGTVLKS